MMKALWNKLKAMLTHVQRRTVILAVIASFAFLLPTMLAVDWANKKDAPAQQSAFSVTVWDQNRKKLATATASEDPTNGTGLADILYRVITEGQQVPRAPFPSEDGTPIYIQSTHNGTSAEYTCYFSISSEESYYIAKDGGIFLMATSAAADFLLLPEAESLFPTAVPPTLTTNTGDTLIPSTAEWFYQRPNKSYAQAQNCTTLREERSYEFAGALELTFAKEPDFCFVRATEHDTGRHVFEGSYQDLAHITVNTGTVLQIHVLAEWDEQPNATSYGTLSYDFTAILRDRSSFSVTRSSLTSGEFLILSCTNVREPSKLSITSSNSFERYIDIKDSTLFCVIPYPEEISSNVLTFTVKYGASTEQFSIPLVTAPLGSRVIIPTSNDTLSVAFSSSAQAEAKALLGTAISSPSETVHFRGNTVSYSENGFQAGYLFGDRISVVGHSTPIVAKGTEYLAPSGTPVPSLLSGQVIATDYCDALGNYAVVDHGLGIQTWYAHLSDFDVRVGDVVACGESVGKTGLGGIHAGSGFLLLCTVNGHLCNPQTLIGLSVTP